MHYRLRLFMLASAAALWLPAEEQPDLAIVHRIRTEAFENSKVMDHMFHLTDVNVQRIPESCGLGRRQGPGVWIV
ncbi:MAG: hypothetical protein LC126_02730 [Bryobacterales bacterium]|nr:hypothetical protein [Bryobacterales bacterium]